MQQSNNNNNIIAPATDLENMITAATGLCQLSLWQAILIADEVTILLKQKIRLLLLGYADQYAGYVELIQRILLTKEYIRLCGTSHICITPSVCS